ncbi:MAG: uroporphyrinogen decarboxylase family protein [Candidatus Latescibacterota bacterium]|jgi:uroporphyrinogen decarboxylase
MTSRERLRTALRRQPPDRLPRVEQSYWPETLARWRTEGMPADAVPAELFDLDPFVSFGLDHSLRLTPLVLSETDEWVIDRDADGVVHRRWKHSYHTPGTVDFLIKTRADWEQHAERLAYDPARISDEVRRGIVQANRDGQFCTISPGEPVWWVISALGMERALLTLAEDPGFFAAMMTAQTELALRMTRQLLGEGYRPDAILFSSDLCFRNGMLFSPKTYRRLMMEHHRQYARLCHEHDMLFILHCDGDVRQFIPLLIEAGFDCIEPLEARAGNDVRELKPRYGDRLSFFGNIDMDVLATGNRAAIRHEVTTKVRAASAGGGYIHQSDHSVPPTVSYDAYRYWMDLAQELGG